MRNTRRLPRYVKLELERLEDSREAPSVTPWITDTFEGVTVPATSPPGSPPPMPVNWSQYNSDGTTQFAVTNTMTSPSPAPPALSGDQSLSVMSGSNGLSHDVSRAWLNETMPADVQVSAAVYVNSLIPAQVIARGSYLNTSDDPQNGANGPSFYAAELSSGSPGPELAIVDDVNGTYSTTPLASIYAPNYINGQWLEETLDVEGSTIRAQLFNPTTGEYLNSSDEWQTTQAWALTVINNAISGPGFVGVGRPSSYTGTVTFDDFSVQTPSTDQTFDATPVGALPDNWTSYVSNPSDSVAVASPTNPTAFSGPNALAITPYESSDTDRAWLNTSLTADLSVSAYTYADTLTPAQVFARGSNLSTTTPSYYAVQVSRGYLTVSLVKVVNGTQTVLNSVSSTTYVPDVWVQETLELSGDDLTAIVYRPDTGQYLSSDGSWQSSWTAAVTATDSSITTGGQAGVGRPVTQPLYVETSYFDDFTTATGTDAQDFDSTSAGSIPTGWTQWSSNGNNNYFSVAAAPSSSQFLSANNVLESTAVGSTVTAQVWDENESLTNAQVSTGLYLASPMPAVYLIARGTGLGTTTPSYYGLEVTTGETGPIVKLERVNNGTMTDQWTFTMTDAGYVNTPIWIQETLYVDGGNVRVSIYRADTGQYLNSDGQWQTLPAYAVNMIDPDPLIQAGYAGLVRSNSSGTVYLDNFAVVPLSVDSTPPTMTVSAPSGTQSGTVTITATPTETVPGYSISEVEFYVDGVLNWTATAAPYTWDFNTSSVSNTTHTILVMAYDDEGNIGTATTTITTSNNTTLMMPSGFPPHSNQSVEITELDYEGTNGSDSANQTLVQNDVDVVVGATTPDITSINSWDSSVQQLLYTNVSNIYEGLLTAWMNYAETNGINPEDAFYHVAVATPYANGSTASTQPVDEFWGVYDANGANDTANAYTGAGIPFGDSVNQAVYIGYLDPFWEINFVLNSVASGGWSGVLEYPTAVNSSGTPTSWATLTILNDTTDGLTQNGQITFNAPSNWAPASIDGSAMMYYVRIRTVTTGTAPNADTIKGDNYTDSPAGSDGSSGVIPAYDWALDPTGGYLDQAEYAIASAAGYTAHFGYQSRLFSYGPMRFYTNPSNPEFDAWALQYYPDLLNVTLNPQNQYDTGLFVDNSTGDPPGEPGGAGSIETYNIVSNDPPYKIDLVEPIDSYSNDYATLLNEIGLAIAPSNGWIMANTAGSLYLPGDSQDGQTYADAVISKVQAYYEEGGLSAVSDDTSLFQALYNKVYYRATTDDSSYAVIDSRSTDGSETDDQTQLTTLAAYYILAPSNPSQGALDFFGGEATTTPWVNSSGTFNHWSPAAAYNIGTPESPLPAAPAYIQTGTESDGSTYYVYDRQFTESNGQPVLVLYKPISVLDGSASKLTGSASATTVTLNGSYYLLQADGTLSSTAVTSISLENGEGAILVQAETDELAIAQATTVIAPISASPAAVTSLTPSISDSSASQSSLGPTSKEILNAEFFERLIPGLFPPNAAASSQAPIAQPVDPFALWTNLDHVFSAWATARLLKAYGNISSLDESLWLADDAVAALFSLFSIDDPLNPSLAN